MHEPGKVNFFIFGFLLLGRIVISFPVFFVTLVAYNFTFTWLVSKLKFIFAAKTESIALIEGRCRFTLEFFGRYHYLNLVQHIAAIGKLATIILLKMVSLNLVSLAEESSILTLIWLRRSLPGTLCNKIELLVFGNFLVPHLIVLGQSLSKTILSRTNIRSIYRLSFLDLRDIFKLKHASSSYIVSYVLFLVFLNCLVLKEKCACLAIFINFTSKWNGRLVLSSYPSYFLRRNEFIFKIKQMQPSLFLCWFLMIT